MTESELRVESEISPKTCLVDWDSATRWARRLAVQFDVGELHFSFVSREASPAFIFRREGANAFFVGTLPVMVGV